MHEKQLQIFVPKIDIFNKFSNNVQVSFEETR